MEWTDPDRAERLDFDWQAEADHVRKLRAIRERERFVAAISAEVDNDDAR